MELKIDSVLKYVFRVSPKLAFKIEYYLVLTNVKYKLSPLTSFPLLIFLRFNKDQIYKSFLKGRSVERQALIKMAAIIRHINRATKLPSEEVLERHSRFVHYIRAKQRIIREQKEIDDLIKQFPEYRANPDLFTDEIEEL